MNDDQIIRLDICVAKKTGYGRSFAAEIIRRGLVTVNGKPVTKPGEKINALSLLDISTPETVYVGRGGYKLEFALDFFGICLNEKVCADIGAATGGFTDCMLKNGAARVYAIDNGHDQLAESVRSDPRVVVLEDTNVNDITDISLMSAMDFVAVDVSFVSIKKVLNSVTALIKPNGQAVLLVKPQFEAGPGHVGKSGIIRDPKIHKRVIHDVCEAVGYVGLQSLGLSESPVRGKEGNTEFLLYCVKSNCSKSNGYTETR